jgi:hypothetical protein
MRQYKAGKVREWILANAESYDNDTDRLIIDCMKKFGLTRKFMTDKLSRLRQFGFLSSTAFLARSKSVGHPVVANDGKFRMSVDVSEVAKEFDYEDKVKEGISSLGTRLIKDADFRVELGIPIDRWKIVSCLPKFNNNKHTLKGKRFRGLYWGSVPAIRELRKKIEVL